jgi:hypothetical protein
MTEAEARRAVTAAERLVMLAARVGQSAPGITD